MTTYIAIITTITLVITAIHNIIAIWQRHQANVLQKKRLEAKKKKGKV